MLAMKQCLLTLFLISSLQLHAKSLKLAVITSEFDKNVTEYYLETNDKNEIDSMRYLTILPNGGIFEDVTLPAEDVIHGGIVIVERNGYDAVRLEVENFSLKTGGVIRLNYLFSGITGARHIKRIKLVLKDDAFILTDLDNNHINRMFVKVNWNRFFGVIGVKEIQTSLETPILFY
jgi:hypothetical protein